ncbi:MAG: SDR family NAD(P)-dependent oxidoreductase [Pseudomonadota bacterium]
MAQHILITGASSGFGAACARRFARSGATLVLVARRAERLRALREELGPSTPVHVIAADVRDIDAFQRQFEALPDAARDIDVLVNNAGLALGLEPAHRARLDEWETMIETNITALVRMTRLILPGMVERNRGHVVNIGSTAGNWPYPGGNVYGATKAFVQHFSRELRADLLGSAVRVSNIEPGLSETEFSQVRFRQDREKADAVYEGTRPLAADDIADIVHWVCSVPPHVNINALEVMPVCQAWGPLAIHRGMEE